MSLEMDFEQVMSVLFIIQGLLILLWLGIHIHVRWILPAIWRWEDRQWAKYHKELHRWHV